MHRYFMTQLGDIPDGISDRAIPILTKKIRGQRDNEERDAFLYLLALHLVKKNKQAEALSILSILTEKYPNYACLLWSYIIAYIEYNTENDYYRYIFDNALCALHNSGVGEAIALKVSCDSLNAAMNNNRLSSLNLAEHAKIISPHFYPNTIVLARIYQKMRNETMQAAYIKESLTFQPRINDIGDRIFSFQKAQLNPPVKKL